jgi:hypothetical protein
MRSPKLLVFCSRIRSHVMAQQDASMTVRGGKARGGLDRSIPWRLGVRGVVWCAMDTGKWFGRCRVFFRICDPSGVVCGFWCLLQRFCSKNCKKVKSLGNAGQSTESRKKSDTCHKILWCSDYTEFGGQKKYKLQSRAAWGGEWLMEIMESSVWNQQVVLLSHKHTVPRGPLKAQPG